MGVGFLTGGDALLHIICAGLQGVEPGENAPILLP